MHEEGMELMALEDIKIGKTIDEIKIGDSLTVTENIETRDVLLYLGLTDDDNPLYLQYDYSELTKYKRPIVPPVLIMGILTSNISKHLPGPGATVVDFSMDILAPIYHDTLITFEFTVNRINKKRGEVTIYVEGANIEGDRLVEAEIIARTPEKLVLTD